MQIILLNATFFKSLNYFFQMPNFLRLIQNTLEIFNESLSRAEDFKKYKNISNLN